MAFRSRSSTVAGGRLVLAAILGVVLTGAGCSRSFFVTNPFAELSPGRTGELLSAQACRDDLEELFALVERSSPNPYLARTRERVRADFDRLSSSIGEPMNRRQFAGVLREACAAYAVAHQYALGTPETFNAWRGAGGKSPSFELSPSGDRLMIAASTNPDLSVGAEVVSVNFRPASVLLAAMRARTSAETEAYRDYKIAAQSVQHLWELGMEAPYTVELRDDRGVLRSVVDSGRKPEPLPTFADRLAGSQSGQRPGRSEAGHGDAEFRLRWPKPDVAMIEWRVMNPLRRREWAGFLQATFKELDERQAAGLIIDLRQNGGGSSVLAEPLFGYFTETPIRFAAGKEWRKSEDYHRFLRSIVVWWARVLPWESMFSKEYADMNVGEQRRFGAAEPRAVPPMTPRFRGKVAFLIGPGTFSSGAMVADAAATYSIGPLIGQPTGGVPNSLGEIGFRQLTNSGLVISFCSAQFVRANGDASDASPVRPTIEVPPADGGRSGSPDPEVDVALRWIASDWPRQHGEPE